VSLLGVERWHGPIVGALRTRGKAPHRRRLSFILLYDPVALPLARPSRPPPPLRRRGNRGGGGVGGTRFGRTARPGAQPRSGARSRAGRRARGSRDSGGQFERGTGGRRPGAPVRVAVRPGRAAPRSGRARHRAGPAGARRSREPRSPAPAELGPHGAAAARVRAVGRGRARRSGTCRPRRRARAPRLGPRAPPPAGAWTAARRAWFRRCSWGGGGL